MSDAVYRVVIDYELRGDLDRSAGRAGGKLGELGRESHKASHALESLGGKLSSFGGAVADAFTGAVERVAQLGFVAAGVGATAAFGAVAYGAIHLNSELEQTKISLAAIFGAQGVSKDFSDGLSIASDTVTKIREDASKLPVEAGRLVETFTMIATPSFMSGASVDRTREMAKMGSLAGSFLRMPQDMVARELTQLLEGRAGAHNTLGMKLDGLGGDKAQKFNQMSAPKRFAELERIFALYAPAMEAMGNSLIGRWTTAVSTGKNLLRIATAPAFEHLKASLGRLNEGFTLNHERIEHFARHLGNKLGDAYEVGERAILRWAPAVRSFAEEASERIGGLWRRVLPVVQKVGEEIRHFVGSGHALDRLEDVLKLYVAVKAGRGFAGMAGGTLGVAGDVSQLAMFLASRGAAGAGAAGGASSGLFGGGGLLGAAVAAPEVSIPIAAAAVSVLALAAIGATGAVHALSDETSLFHARAVENWKGIREHGENTLAHIEATFKALEPVVMPFVDYVGNELLDSLRSLTLVAEGASGAVLGVAKALHWVADQAGLVNPVHRDLRRNDADDHWKLVARRANNLWDGKPKAGAGGGGGGTHIQKVEIVVSTNQEPSRIARRVVDIIADIGRNPTASRHTPNFSRART